MVGWFIIDIQRQTPYISFLKKGILINSEKSSTILAKANLSYATVESSKMDYALLGGAYLNGVLMNRVDLNHADLSYANVS